MEFAWGKDCERRPTLLEEVAFDNVYKWLHVGKGSGLGFVVNVHVVYMNHFKHICLQEGLSLEKIMREMYVSVNTQTPSPFCLLKESICPFIIWGFCSNFGYQSLSSRLSNGIHFGGSTDWSLPVGSTSV